MINWDKPIETVDGRKARKIQTVQNELWNIVFVPGENFGDVFLINAEGFICGDRTNLKAANRAFIRNARVKREGWVVKYKGINHIHDDQIYPSEESAISKIPVGCVVVRIQWEE